MSEKENSPEVYGDVIGDHNYDGIQEFDNPMPAWWTWIFWIGVVFAPFYIFGISVFGFVDDYEDDLMETREAMGIMEEDNSAPSEGLGGIDLAEMSKDPANLEAGDAVFQQYCLACHGPQAQGTIGPNMTDEYWIHSPDDESMIKVINEGVLAKGMPPWEKILSADEKAQVIIFIRSLEGTNPPNAKAPQGDKY